MGRKIDITPIIDHAIQQAARLIKIDSLDDNAWLELHATKRLLSGRLTHAWKNRELYKSLLGAGVDWQEQYIRERVALTFGFGAESLPASRMALAPVKLEYGDTAMTETCWFADIFNAKTLPSCRCVPAQIEASYSNGETLNGVGLSFVFGDKGPKWLPQNHNIFAFTSHVTTRTDGKKIQSPVRYPGLMSQFSGASDEVLKDHLRRRVEEQYSVGRQEWVAEHRISETLARNIELSKAENGAKDAYVFHNHYLHERAAAEWGYGFDVAPSANLKIGPAISEGDSDPHVQIGRFVHILNENNLFGDRFLARHIKATDMWGTEREGLGIIVEHAHRPPWIGDNTAYALIAEVDPKTKSWLPVINPC